MYRLDKLQQSKREMRMDVELLSTRNPCSSHMKVDALAEASRGIHRERPTTITGLPRNATMTKSSDYIDDHFVLIFSSLFLERSEQAGIWIFGVLRQAGDVMIPNTKGIVDDID